MDCDAAVIWSVLWHGRMKANRTVYEHYRRLGRPVICIDIGALHRGRTWKIAVNNITAQGYYGHTENLDRGRPQKLGLGIGHLSTPRRAVLIAAQHPRSLQVQSIDQAQWFSDVLKTLNADLPVFFRPHPRGPIDIAVLNNRVHLTQCHPVPGTYDSFDIDYNYQTVINYNSGAGVQAALAGASVIVDRSSLAYPISMNGDKQQWLIEVAHTEYLLSEIEQGLWLKRIEHQLVQ